LLIANPDRPHAAYLFPLPYEREVKEKVFSYEVLPSLVVKVWFDILTPKQVMFFKPAVEMLREKGHELLCTSREYREANDLARLRQIDLMVVGKHGGAEKSQKLWQSANRIMKLTEIISAFKPDVAISFSSPEACRVAFGLGIRSIGFNDSPHADAVAKLSVPLLDLLFCPWIIPYTSWIRYGVPRRSIIRYRGLDPIAWLRRFQEGTHGPALTRTNYFPHKKGDNMSKKTILVRMEEAQASYIAFKQPTNATVKMLDRLINNLSDIANFFILCRYDDQKALISNRYPGKVTVIPDIVDGLALISQSDIFIGAGGTMTAEAALLGKPTISIAPSSFYVEKYLLSHGLILKASGPEDLARITRNVAINHNYAAKQLKKATRAVEEMEDPIEKLLSLLTNEDKIIKLRTDTKNARKAR
jgi:predicted glycosyltransferase